MDVSQDVQRLLAVSDQLPSDLLAVLHPFDDANYLDVLTKWLLDRRYTDTILAACESILPYCCTVIARLGLDSQTLAVFGRIIPFAPYLINLAEAFLCNHAASLDTHARKSGLELEYLLALYRLLHHDHHVFAPLISLQKVQAFLVHADPAVRCLAGRLIARYLCAADAAARNIYVRTVPNDDAHGDWEGKRIHYKYLTLWERQRYRNLKATLKFARQFVQDDSSGPACVIPVPQLRSAAVLLGGILLPGAARSRNTSPNSFSSFVNTPTTDNNLRRLALALKSSRPLLVAGLPGAGRTSLVRHAAFALGKLESMITLHLNEQCDAKALIGLYTSGTRPGSFEWQPGALTKAVTEGRWLLIEDLDKAPTDVLSTLLPLLEKRQLTVSGQQRTINAAAGFRIIATVRVSTNAQGQELIPTANMLGARHWRRVKVEAPAIEELPTIINSLYPVLSEHTPTLTDVFRQLETEQQLANLRGQSQTGIMRYASLRDLLKWASRVDAIVASRSSISSDDHDQIFLAAVDSFAGSLPYGPALDTMIDCIAQHLQIDPQRAMHVIAHRDVRYTIDNHFLTIGPCRLQRQLSKGPRPHTTQRAFSKNPFTLRLMERIAAGISQKEPLLLVGETGTGKTTVIQHLADQLGKKLLPFNLSQQSESSDLLGGFKPVNIRSLMVQLKEEFDTIFYQSFSPKVILRNQSFLDTLAKLMARGDWLKVCKLWNKALDMVAVSRKSSDDTPPESPNPSKKRKTAESNPELIARWEQFTTSFRNVERRLLAGGESSFAFAFVEGELIKAVRNGDWVLLDEINLASSDTLESIAELLDKTPSITLSETGNVERVHAHSDFRVFAAMNPATDVGKKDLPLGIRSRFTELYVESPDKDRVSLQHIIRTYLGPTENALAAAVSALHLEIQELAHQDMLVDGAGQRPHYSLRTLTRALSYATDIATQCSLRRALAEAFQMSYLTILDLESETRVQNAIVKHFYQGTSRHDAELNQPLRPLRDQSAAEHVQVGRYWLRKGLATIEDQPHYIITDFVRRNLDKLIRATSAKRSPVLLQGPTSAGKTSMVEYLAKRTGNKFVRINNHEHTDLQEYLGSYASTPNGKMEFQEGVLVRALREGHWIVLDELNLAPTDVLEALNRLLDDNRELLIPETQEIVRPHKDFMLFATQNPAGLYGGRKFLSRAFRNRFLELFFNDIPIDELHIILQKRTQIPQSWSQRIVTVYKELSLLRQKDRVFEQKAFATLRDLFRWASRPAETIQQLAINGFLLLGERVRDATERSEVKRIIEKVLSQKGPKVAIDESDLYSHVALALPKHLSGKAGCNGIVWTSAMRRLYVLTLHAIRNDEPVLLIGDTGCGKTSVCQLLASVHDLRLHIVNAHQNLETGDLIGAQRPLRNRADVEERLSSILTSLELASVADAARNEGIDAALTILDDCEDDLIVSADIGKEISKLRARRNALFEWVDGSLVEAMKTGQMFLLDEIALADDSVLERLNSLLESQRSILLAEKGSLGSAITAQPGFQFFATMNPGGDYGKKELSPALRNRFTEIWVPPLTETDDMVQVLQDKLLTPAFAPSMVDFAQWFSRRFNKSASDTISMRDLLTWVSFVNQYATDTQGRAPHVGIVHGAALVYIDGLGANPAALLDVVAGQLDHERAQCVQALSRCFDIDAKAVYNAPVDCYTAEHVVMLGWDEGDSACFEIPRRQTGTESAESHGDFTLLAPTTKLNALRIARGLQLTKPILLEGNPGVGKTSLVTALAGMCNVPLTRINLSEQTDLMDLFGSDAPVEGAGAGIFAWRDASFLRAMKNGEWVLLDEMNLASQSVLEGLNACLDHRGEVYIAELQQTFKRHPDFRLFAAQNPHHQGGGRKGLPASFVNRFTVVYADVFSRSDLLQICGSIFRTLDGEHIARIVSFIEDLDMETSTGRLGVSGSPWEFNLRDTIRWLSLYASEQGLLNNAGLQDFLSTVIVQRFRSRRDRDRAVELFLGPQTDELHQELFHTMTDSLFQVGAGLLSRDTLSVPMAASTQPDFDFRPHLTVLQSVMISIQQKWPVLLVGPSGCGKTVLLESLARVTGADLVTMSLNADLDATDLVGGYEQLDPAQNLHDLSARLRSFLARTSLYMYSTADVLRPDIEEVGMAAQSLSSHGGQISSWLRSIVASLSPALARDASTLAEALEASSQSSSATDNKGRFGWIDGMLVKAVQRGQWLVLDNANLCDAAALDRLNSLLEPNGTLIISEHPCPDGSPHIITPHPNFRVFLTMDPKYGELSRALRNRALELFMLPAEDSNSASSPAGPLVLDHEADLQGVSQIAVLSQPSPTMDLATCAEIVAGHLSGLQLDSANQILEQVSNGLFSISHQLFAQAINSTSHARSLVHTDRMPGSALTSLQPFHPWNNAIASRAMAVLPEVTWTQGAAIEIALDVARMSSALNTIAQMDRPPQAMTRLQRSANRDKISSAAKQSTAGVFAHLQGIVEFLRRLVQRGNEGKTLSRQQNRSVIALRRFWWNLFDFTNQSTFEEAPFATYKEIGNQIVIGNSHDLHSELKLVVRALGSKSLSANAETMRALWKALKPVSLQSHEQLQDLVKLEQLADRFDLLARSFSTPLEPLVHLRQSFKRALTAVRSGEQASGLLQALETALVGLIMDEETPAPPHFQALFENLLRTLDLFGTSRSDSFATVLSLKPTRSGLEMLKNDSAAHSAAFLTLSRYAGDGRADLMPLLQDTQSDMLKQIQTLENVPISRMALLRQEMAHLSSLYTTNAQIVEQSQSEQLSHVLKQLLDDVESIYATGNEGQDAVDANLDPLADMTSANSPASSGVVDEVRQLHFRPVSTYLRNDTASETHQGVQLQASSAWISFALGCIKLYVPSEAHDPALKPFIQRDMYNRYRDSLESKLRALRNFETFFTGQMWSPHIQEMENELMSMGAPPIVNPIVRPIRSEVDQLQSVFNALLRLLAPLYTADISQMSDFVMQPVFVANLAQIEQRLRNDFRAYEDIVYPLLGFLDCLKVGMAISMAANVQSSAEQAPNTHLLRATPLCGAHPVEMTAGVMINHLDDVSWKGKLHLLRSFEWTLKLQTTNEQSDLENVWSKIHTTFDKAYQTWKMELSADQDKNTANTSLYRHRGGDEDQDEVDEQEFAELFGILEEDVVKSGETTNLLKTPMNTMSRAFSEILQSLASRSESTAVSDLIQHVEPALSLGVEQSTKSSINTTLAPLLVARLSITSAELDPEVKPPAYSIYTDVNVAECHKLLLLVRRVQSRFKQIQEVWPEHATLGDVLQTCKELEAFSHRSPLAKIITKVEKLHEYIHEWQRVASSEFSATGLFDAVTDLIVGWRQLELSTWSRMLDLERTRCEHEAHNWFFVAYENIVAVPIRMQDETSEIHPHVVELVKTLDGFLRNAGIGQFHTHLQSIERLQQYIALRSAQSPFLGLVSSTLRNFVTYMTRFKYQVGEVHRKGREKINKEIKDVIQLASWKDRNIDALRQSAKASHRKLFKYIRKYRSLLGQPAGAIIQSGGDMAALETVATTTLPVTAVLTMPVIGFERHAEMCEQSMVTFAALPTRFKNIMTTVEVMQSMTRIPEAALDCPGEVEAWLRDVIESAAQLRKATPAIFSEEKKSAIQHLKVQKRRLFADVLREVRTMGFKTGLGSDALTKQESQEVLLTNLAPLVASDPVLSQAQSNLHGLMHYMPLVRSAGREHSADLSGAEVTRSIGLLEAMLETVAQQVSFLYGTQEQIQPLADVLSEVEFLAMSSGTQQAASRMSGYTVQQAIACLSSILDATIWLLSAQSQLAGVDISTALEGLRSDASDMRSSRSQRRTLRIPDVTTVETEQCDSADALLLEKTRSKLLALTESHPYLEPLLKQTLLWTQPTPIESVTAQGSENRDVDAIVASTTQLCDSVLASIEAVNKTLTSLPTSSDDTSWFLLEQETLMAALTLLRPRQTATALQSILNSLGHVSLNSEPNVQLGVAVLATFSPILREHHIIVTEIFGRLSRTHCSTTLMSVHLAKLFTTIAESGFCAPSEKSAGDNDQTDKLEGGTGLGDGDGAEDISKDIGDDEDLDELAQEPNEKRDGEEIEDEKDAVDMADADMEGEMGEAEEPADDEDKKDDEDEKDEEMDEEVGNVDDLGPSTLDEKMWDDGGKDDDNRDREGDDAAGTKDDDDVAAAGEEKDDKAEKDEKAEKDGEDGEEDEEAGVDEDEQVRGEDGEKLDPHVDEQENLDLPDDINMDGQGDDETSMSDGDDFEDDMGDELPDGPDTEQNDMKPEDGEADEAGSQREATPDITEEEPDQAEGDDAGQEEDGERTQDAGEETQEEAEEDQDTLQDSRPDDSVPADQVDPTQAQGTGLSDQQDQQEHQTQANQATAEQEQGDEGEASEAQQVAGSRGQRGQAQRQEQVQTEHEQDEQDQESLPFKKLGDALNEWYKQRQQIADAQPAETEQRAEGQADIDMAGAEFEHLPDESADADAQALGAATEDQATALDEDAGLTTNGQETHEHFPPETEEDKQAGQDTEMHDAADITDVDETAQQPTTTEADEGAKAFVGEYTGSNDPEPDQTVERNDDFEETDELDEQIKNVQLESIDILPEHSADDARSIWLKHETATHTLSLALTEHLRLILAPTKATRLRGDFRTGKRLNMKRIIPYIASQYRRDKIWMRRSVPSKRAYQIMLCVDDSKSMGESTQTTSLAFDTLALVARSLSMVEAGDLCIVRFGNEPTVVHDFGTPFTAQSGAEVVRGFSFEQTQTDVGRLLESSLDMFETARRTAPGSARDLWQLQFVISDGVCRDHAALRRLVRKATEARIMIVFVIVDPAGDVDEAALNGAKSNGGILDLQTANFTKDENGMPKVETVRYLETFPFRYYLIVRDTGELPVVLAGALRQWFAEVVDSA